MKSEDIIMKMGIIHILESLKGTPILSDYTIDMGSDLSDFLKAHIEKLSESDDVKYCQFTDDSQVKELLQNCSQETFIETSKKLAGKLYDIMNANINIPAADITIIVFSCGQEDYIAFLKMNYKSFYTHVTKDNSNSIILQKAILPGQAQKLSEGFIFNLVNGELLVAEKKYEVNGEKRCYFSELFLRCRAPFSQKSKLDIVTRAIEQINKKYYGEDDAMRKMEIKNVICQELEEEGSLFVETIQEKVFSQNPEMQLDFSEKLDKYNMSYEVIAPKNEQTIKKFKQQYLATETGVEIMIPMEEYRNPNHIEFIPNEDGTISVLVKNIMDLRVR